MIDANNIIKYDRKQHELQELILFLVCVAGKKASTVSKSLDSTLGNISHLKSPFALIRDWCYFGLLREKLERGRFGQYNKLEKSFRQLAYSGLDLRTCSKEDLMQIHGIGRKSASCFLAWTRKGENVAMLDTHLMKWLTKLKVNLNKSAETVPMGTAFQRILDLLNSVEIGKATPSSTKVYDTLEEAFLLWAKIFRQDATELDLAIWKRYANGGVDKIPA